jgi:hypothetical protein
LEANEPILLKEQAKLLRENHMLQGLAPLYQDYGAEHYYFEVIQFVVTLFLVAVAVCVPLLPNFLSLSYDEQIQHLAFLS